MQQNATFRCLNAPSAVDILESVKVRVRFNLPVFFKRFRSSRRRRYFARQCGEPVVRSRLLPETF